jgi:hypothetical protein
LDLRKKEGQMKTIQRITLAVLAFALVLLAPAATAPTAAAAVAPTYGDYSMMLIGGGAGHGAAAQYWSGDQAGGKWEWHRGARVLG